MAAPAPRATPIAALGALLLAGSAALGVAALGPPSPRPADAPATEFSAARARRHLEVITRAPHPVGSPAHAQVRDYLLSQLRALGLDPQVQEATWTSRFAGNEAGARLRNVVAVLPGKRPGGPAVLLAAHYDAVPQSLGASDDGAGVATLLETARALRAGPQPEGDVILLFSDGEELGLLGAQAFVAEHPLWPRVAVALNFEARGTGGAATMFDTSAQNGPLLEALGQTGRPVASSLVSALAQALPNDTDATAFKRGGAPTLSFAYAEGVAHYHRRTDDLAHQAPGSLQHHGDQALALARMLSGRDAASLRGPDVAYLSLPGGLLLRYPPWFARLLAGLELAGLVALGVGARRRGRLSGRGLAVGLGVALLGLLAAPLAAGLYGAALGRALDTFWLLERSERLLAGALGLAFAALAGLVGLGLRRASQAELALGGLGIALLPQLALAALAPVATPPFALAALAALVGTGAWLLAREPDRAPAQAALWLGGAPVGVLQAGLIFAVGVAVAGAPAAPALFLALAFPLWAPQVATLGWRRVALAGLGAALLAGVWTLAGAHYSPADPQADNLGWSMDSEAGRARLFSRDARLDAYDASALGPAPERAALPEVARSPAPAWVAPASAPTQVPAQVELARDAPGPEGRALTLRLTSPGAARCVRLWDDGGAPVHATRVAGREVHPLVRFSPERDEALLRRMTGDDTPQRWHLELCGMADQPWELELSAPAGAPVKLRIVQVLDGLPPTLLPRPPEAVPAQTSDLTLVGQAFQG